MEWQARRNWLGGREVLLEEVEGKRGRVSGKGALSKAVLSVVSLNILLGFYPGGTRGIKLGTWRGAS
jgi:hypothetical protein